MLTHIQDLTHFKNHRLNNEIDEVKCLLVRKQEAFRDVARATRLTLENLPRDFDPGVEVFERE